MDKYNSIIFLESENGKISVMKKVEIVSGNQGKIILVDGKELPNNKPNQTKEKSTDIRESDLVDIEKMTRVRQRHMVTTDSGIVGGSYMSEEQKLTLAIETREGEESRILTAQVNKKAGIAD